MRKFIFKITLLFSGLALISCEAENLYDREAEDYNTRMLSAFIYDSDLVGEWELNAIIAENPVDLNKDGVSNSNLLSETSCFDTVIFKFTGNKTFSSVKYSMEFKQGEDGEEFRCMGKTTESGDWIIKNNILTFYINQNGSVQKFEREIILRGDSFVFEVNANESANYIKDHGGTSASGISIVALEYSRLDK